MDPENSSIVSHVDQDQYSVTFPYTREEFKEFVGSLLGEPQTIDFVVLGAYIVDRDTIEDIFSLLSQRLDQQNQASLVQATFRTLYSDNTSVRLTSIEDFKRYRDVKPKIAQALHVYMAFLVQFPDRRTPEKQVIEVSFYTGMTKDYSSLFPQVPKSHSYLDTGFYVSIKHTARSWGVDIENLLQGHLRNTKRVPRTALSSFLKTYSGEISFVSSCLMFLTIYCSAMLTLWIEDRKNAQNIERALNNIPAGSELINALKLTVDQGSPSNLNLQFSLSILMLLFSIVVAVGFGFYVNETVGQKEYGALLLTKQSEDELAAQSFRAKRIGISTMAGAIYAILAGVIGNVIFGLITNGLRLSH